MTNRLCLLLLCALAPTALVTGCGGSNNSKSPGGTHLSIAAVKQQIKVETSKSYALCQRAAAASLHTPTERATMQAMCTDIQTGNIAGLRSTERQVCVEEAKALPGALGKRSLAQCKQ